MKDKKLQKLISQEVRRQNQTLDFIASENIVSPEILQALGSPLTNKYSEGYPEKRYYPGNEYCDAIERLAQERALKSFGLNPQEWSVNVQPYSGSPANFAIYGALMKPGETLIGMKLSAGGHLTHGHTASFSGKFFNAVQYGVSKKTGLLNYREIEKLARQYRPRIIVAGTTAYPRMLNFQKFRAIAKSTGAYLVADISHIAGLVLTGLHPSPFPHSDAVMTTTHKTLQGARGAIIFARKGPDRDLAASIDRGVFPGLQGGPHNNITAAHALMFFEASQPAFRKYQRQIIKNAAALAEALIKLNFQLVTGGTDNHLVLIDLKKAGLDGTTAEKILEQNGIIANRNSIPDDTKPFKPSGLRMGTPSVTARGLKEKEMKLIASLIHRCLIKKEGALKETAALCKKFPLPY